MTGERKEGQGGRGGGHLERHYFAWRQREPVDRPANRVK